MATQNQPEDSYTLEIKLPNIPDVAGEFAKDQQLRDLLVAIKTTLEMLTGSHASSNDYLIRFINMEKNDGND